MNTLERQHISMRVLDQTHSKEALRLFIRKLDPRKVFFYQSDIDEFRANYELRLIELIKQLPDRHVDVEPAFVIYNRYLQRLKERVEMVQHILSQPIDFTVEEYFVKLGLRNKAKEWSYNE
jgi:carboxyl-terminal processing protease